MDPKRKFQTKIREIKIKYYIYGIKNRTIQPYKKVHEFLPPLEIGKWLLFVVDTIFERPVSKRIKKCNVVGVFPYGKKING